MPWRGLCSEQTWLGEQHGSGSADVLISNNQALMVIKNRNTMAQPG